MAIVWWMLTAIATLVASTCAYANSDVHVAVSARADGDGSKQSPFQSLMQARDGIRAARRSGSLKIGEAVTVHVGPGGYRLESTFKLTVEDSGTADAPVIYRAQRPGASSIHGGISLKPSEFRLASDPGVLSRIDADARGKVQVCDLASLVPDAFEAVKTAYRGAPAAPWLYVNHRPMPLARWPNADAPGGGWARFSKAVDTGLPNPDATDPSRRKARPGSFEFSDPRPARWNLNGGVWLQGYWTHDWSDEVIRVASYDKAAQVITLAAPHNYGIAAGTWGEKQRRFFALNTLDELDVPGEWYLDRPSKRL
jgi:hypothetical protein